MKALDFHVPMQLMARPAVKCLPSLTELRSLMHFARPALPPWRVWLWVGLLTVLPPRTARAEDAVTYKFQDYAENGRVGVRAHYALIEKDLTPDLRVKWQGVIDSIAGATPNGQPAPAGSDQVVLSTMHERRKAWSAECARQFPRINVALGVANSRESDYISTGWSVNTLTDFNQKNTTLLVGVAGTADEVKLPSQGIWREKPTSDVIVGVTQLLDARTSLTLNLSWGRATGYLSDPYKLVQKRLEVIPGIFLPSTFAENRPDERTKWIAQASLNRAFPGRHGALEASYRFYHDTFGLDAHTAEFAWFQRFGERFVLRPGLRFYDQSAADFYYYQLDATSIMPVRRAGPGDPFYSSDFRLSAMRTYTYGLKAIWTAMDRLQLDIAFERYDMRGKDGVTPQSAYFSADIVTVGAKFSF